MVRESGHLFELNNFKLVPITICQNAGIFSWKLINCRSTLPNLFQFGLDFGSKFLRFDTEIRPIYLQKRMNFTAFPRILRLKFATILRDQSLFQSSETQIAANFRRDSIQNCVASLQFYNNFFLSYSELFEPDLNLKILVREELVWWLLGTCKFILRACGEQVPKSYRT